MFEANVAVWTALKTSIPAEGDLVNFRVRVSDLLAEIKDVIGAENILKQVSVGQFKCDSYCPLCNGYSKTETKGCNYERLCGTWVGYAVISLLVCWLRLAVSALCFPVQQTFHFILQLVMHQRNDAHVTWLSRQLILWHHLWSFASEC